MRKDPTKCKEDFPYNCELVVVQHYGEESTLSSFKFNDYRVATAIENILCNVINIEYSRDKI